MSKKLLILLVSALLLTHFIIIVYCIKENSPTCDEIAHHVASGYSYLIKKDFRMNPANPPLIRELSALPLLSMKLNMPSDAKSWEQADSPVFGREFFYSANKNSDDIIFWARVPIALLSVVLGLLVFLWSSGLFGNKGGLLSLSLYSFSPNIIAHAGLATVDLGTTLLIFASVYSFYRFLRKRSGKSMLIAGVLFGLALASKYTSVFLLPVFLLLSINSGPFLKILRGIFGIFLIGAAVLFTCYFFEVKPLLKNVPDTQEKIAYVKDAVKKLHLDKIGITEESALYIAQNAPVPFSTYLIGLGGVVHQSSIGGYSTFLLGKFRDAGFWYYFIVAFLVKTTIPVLLLFLCSAVLLLKSDKEKLKDILFLIVPIVLFFIVISGNKGQVGIRHLLPIYPFIFTFVGLADTMRMKALLKNCIFTLLIAWQMASLIMVLPYPISYFNEASGGPDNGYKILRDSNIDWGHGLKALKKYIKDKNIDSIKLYYFGTADPAYYGITFDNVTGPELKNPSNGIYAISVQYLDTVEWTKKYNPAAKVAHSIFIYEI